MKRQNEPQIIQLSNGEIKILNRYSNKHSILLRCVSFLFLLIFLLMFLVVFYFAIDFGIPRYMAKNQMNNHKNIELGCLSNSGERNLKGKTMYYIYDSNRQILKKQTIDNLIISNSPAYNKYYLQKININPQYNYCNQVQFIQIKFSDFFSNQVFLYDFYEN